MTLAVETPATLFDMAELGGARTTLHWAVVKEMWTGGETFAVRFEGRLIALVGLYPIDGGAEAWFNVTPEAGRHLNSIIRHTRLTLASRPYPEIVVICTSEAGRVIARRLGFRFAEKHERGEVWHGQFVGWRQRQGTGACEAAGGAAAAPDACGSGAAAG